MTRGTGPRANHASACRRRLNGGAGGGDFCRCKFGGADSVSYILFGHLNRPPRRVFEVFSDVELCGSAFEGCPNKNIEVFLKKVFCASLLFLGGFEVHTR